MIPDNPEEFKSYTWIKCGFFEVPARVPLHVRSCVRSIKVVDGRDVTIKHYYCSLITHYPALPCIRWTEHVAKIAYLFNPSPVLSLTPLWSGERRCKSRRLKIRLFPMPQKGYSVLVCLILISGPPVARWAGRAVLTIARLVLSNPNREENLGRCRAHEAVTGSVGRDQRLLRTPGSVPGFPPYLDC